MPNRIIREGINSSLRVEALKWDAEVFYRRLHSIVDDYGRCEALPMLLKSRCFPLRDSVRTSDITRWLTECEAAGLILGYAVNGKRYIQVLDFRQQIRTSSKCPCPPNDTPLLSKCAANAHVVVSVSGGVVPPKQAAVKKTETAWEAWIDANREIGRKDPLPLGPDTMAAQRILTAMNEDIDRFKAVCKAYLADTAQFLMNKGHELHFLSPAKYEDTRTQAQKDAAIFNAGAEQLARSLKGSQ